MRSSGWPKVETPRFAETLAERLGIDLTHLSGLFLDTDSALLTEEEIEKRFGLVDTTRNPLLLGPTPLLQTWRLENLRTLWKAQDWSANPPPDSQPLIDPDLIGPSDLVTPVTGDPAYDLLKKRENDVAAQLTSLKSAPQTFAGFDANLTATLGVPVTNFLDIDTDRTEGKSILKSLEALSLKPEEYDYLLRIRTLLNKGQPILDAEWGSVYAILVQVWKRKNWVKWRNEEQTAKLLLSPVFFQIPPPIASTFPRPQPTPFEIWRAPPDARIAWQDRLQTRIDQEQTVIQALHQAVSVVEEATLPMLRDALVLASDAVGADLPDKAEWVTKNLLIDARMDGCAMTTRIAQAIETIQGLLSSLRTEQLADVYRTFKLKADEFDEEWKWMGSYATWRGAMFVFLYPENILQPSLRKWKTPGFEVVLQKSQSSRALTADDACEIAREYSTYFRDICTLRVEASCTSLTRLLHGEGCSKVDNGYRQLFYMFGRGGHTGAVYWSAFAIGDASGYSQTFWEPISSTVKEFTNIVEVVGAIPYQVTSGQRYIFLFARKEMDGVQTLVCARYDLENQKWQEGILTLSLPVPNLPFYAVVKQQDSESNPPHIAIEQEATLYEGKLLPNGSGLEDGGFKAFDVVPPNAKYQRTLVGMVASDSGSFFSILEVSLYASISFPAGKSYVECRHYAPLSAPGSRYKWNLREELLEDKYLGSFSWPNMDGIYIVAGFYPNDLTAGMLPRAAVERVRIVNGNNLGVTEVNSPFGFSEPRVVPTSGVLDDAGGLAKRSFTNPSGKLLTRTVSSSRTNED